MRRSVSRLSERNDIPIAVIDHYLLCYCSDRSAINFIQVNRSAYVNHYPLHRWKHKFNEVEMKDLVQRTQISNHKMPLISSISFTKDFNKPLTSLDGKSILSISLTSLT